MSETQKTNEEVDFELSEEDLEAALHPADEAPMVVSPDDDEVEVLDSEPVIEEETTNGN